MAPKKKPLQISLGGFTNAFRCLVRLDAFDLFDCGLAYCSVAVRVVADLDRHGLAMRQIPILSYQSEGVGAVFDFA